MKNPTDTEYQNTRSTYRIYNLNIRDCISRSSLSMWLITSWIPREVIEYGLTAKKLRKGYVYIPIPAKLLNWNIPAFPLQVVPLLMLLLRGRFTLNIAAAGGETPGGREGDPRWVLLLKRETPRGQSALSIATEGDLLWVLLMLLLEKRRRTGGHFALSIAAAAGGET